MASTTSSSSSVANSGSSVIQGYRHEQARNRHMPHVTFGDSAKLLDISFSQQPAKPQSSETASCSLDNQFHPSAIQQQLFPAPSSNLTGSSHLVPRQVGSGPSRDTQELAKSNNDNSISLSKPNLSSPGQESTWSQYAGRLRNLSQLYSPKVYTTPSKTRVTRESSPAASIKSQTPTTTGSSAFSFLAVKMAALKATTSPSSPTAGCGDELIDLDIEAALFPNGVSQDTPAAYKDLQINAIDLLRRFQVTYQNQTIEFRTLKADREALDDEKSEAETRAQHTQMQLQDLVRKSAEKEAAMRALMEELQRENRLLVQDRQLPARRTALSITSTLSEDLCAEEDQAKNTRHHSGDTIKTGAGSDTDEESVADASIFSRSRSPTQATTMSETGLTESLPHGRAPIPAPSYQKPSQLQMTAFRKLMRNISGDADVRIVTECSNCQGQDASIAWDTARLMRDENRGLKMRVAELESALEGALDIVNGLGF